MLSVRVEPGWDGYRLLDCGDGEKLEAFGNARLVRPEPQALWPRADPHAWRAVDARFEGSADEEGPGRWSAALSDFPVPCEGISMACRLTANRHVGLFPEQRPHWQRAVASIAGVEDPRVLNLFGYTGAASLLLAKAGATVTHVDASKKAIAWGRECQALSGLNDAPIRWICDDAQKFAAREVRRGRRYHLILLDPPKYGRGPKGEVFDLFAHLPALMADVAALTGPETRLVILTAYAIRASALAIGRLARATLPAGDLEIGELALADPAGRLLPTSMYAEWRP